MSFNDKTLARSLADIAGRIGAPSRYVVGFSGGMDSAVLLHALLRSESGLPILALHVDHGLHEASADWAARACEFAGQLGVSFDSIRAAVDRDGGKGPEAAAREARYAAFESRLEAGDWLLSAHHRDDQAETLMLNLLRGSGPLGLAGMQAIRPLGRGHLVRPLLHVGRSQLAAYAHRKELGWIEDPANADLGFDRNFLRHRVLPRLAERWPDAAARLGHSAALARDAQALIDDLAAMDLERVATASAGRLSIAALRELDYSRQRNLLRFACRTLSLPSPPLSRLDAVLTDLVEAKPDATPLVLWPGVEIRRFRDELFLLAAAEMVTAPGVEQRIHAGETLSLGRALGSLTLERGKGPGIPENVARAGLTVTTRSGGERIRLAANGRSRSLKKLLQAEGVLPWMRDRLPILKDGADVVAVAGLWINAEFASEPGYRVLWHDQPALI